VWIQGAVLRVSGQDVAPDERVDGRGESAFAAMPTLPDINEPVAGGAAIGSLPPPGHRT
jgi:hypothetical protein